MMQNSDHSPSPSRREFLAGSAGLALSVPMLAAATGAPRPAGHGEGLIRVGLVGCGGRGTGAARQALSTKGDVKLVAMGDAFADRLQGSLGILENPESGVAERVKVEESHRFVGFDAYEKVLASDIDLVILATPPHFRAQQFAAAVKAGKHVFMEKPVAVDGDGVRQVLASAQEAKQKKLAVGVGLQRHHQYGYLEAMKRVHAGEIGEVLAARAYWNMGELWVKDRQPEWSDMEWQMRNWLYFTWLSGDHIVEQHIHNIDVINWAKRAHPIRAQGMGGRQMRTDPKFGHIFDHHAVQFEYADGSFMFSQCRQMVGCKNDVSEHLIGSKGRCDMNTGNWEIKGEKPWRYTGEKNNPYQTEHDDLFASIRAGAPINEGRQGAESSMTAIMGRMATYSGRQVSWDEALASERLGPRDYGFGDLPTPPVPMPGIG